MTEDEAQAWLRDELGVSRETNERIERFISLLHAEMDHQNLISKGSFEHIWARHIVDSAQLLPFAMRLESGSSWLDLGTGAGFPGIIVAILGGYQVTMVESRKRRADFLTQAIEALNIGANARVLHSRLETVEGFPADIISARAFAPLDRLIALSHRFSTENTLWLLPKGKNAVRELQGLSPNWQKMFHVEQSLTDPEAGILVGNA